MTVSLTAASVRYTGNGATTSFNITMTHLANSHLVVRLILISDGTITTQTSGVDFNFVGGNPATSIQFVTAPSALYYVDIVRETPKTQSTNFDVGQTYITEAVEDTVDKLTLIVQELAALIADTTFGTASYANAGSFTIASGGQVEIEDLGSQFIRVAGSGAAITLDASNPIEDGTEDGQSIRIIGQSATNTVTIPTGGNVNLNGTCVLGLNEIIELMWIEGNSTWYEVSRSV